MKLLQKTVLVAATALVAVSSAHAEKKNFRNGVYAGAEMGWLHEDHKYHERVSFLATKAVPGSSSKHSDAFLPGIFLGYRQFMNCYFVGFELSALINSSSTHSSFKAISEGSFLSVPLTATVKQHFKGKYNIISALTFGRHFNDRVGIYGKIAYDFGQYNYRLREISPNGILTNSKKSHKDLNRLLLGVGTEYAINCLWSARLEYNYSFGTNKKNIKLNHTAGANTGINDYRIKVKASSSALKVGMFAKF